MSWRTEDIPDLSDRTAVVTGANGGLGLHTAHALAGAGAAVVIAARDRQRTATAVTALERANPGAQILPISLDLASLRSVEQAAESILEATDKVDILVNNAGVMATPEQRTEDGFEVQLGVNHLGHWALTARLMPALLRAESARVVTVTSFARLTGQPVSVDNPHMEGRYGPWKAYGNSKLANLLFAIGLHMEFQRRRLPASSMAAHPGLAHTELQVRTVEGGATGILGRFWKWAAGTVGMEGPEAALPQVRAATDPGASSGEIYGPRFMVRGAAVGRSVRRRGLPRDVDLLWEVSERETGLPLFQSAD